MNRVVLVGRLTKDVELRYRKIAKPGEERKSDFLNIVAWNKLADIASSNLSKGYRVGIVGSIQNRCWEKEDGTKKYITEVIAEDIEFLDNKRRDELDINILTGNTEGEDIERIQTTDDNDDLPF